MKMKKNDDAKLSDIISPKILANVDSISKSYHENISPYPHGYVEGLFVDGFLEQVLNEVKHNLKAKFKESDLFRVYQSIDLGNLDPKDETMAQNMPAMMKLRKNLYSDECRAFIEQISGIEPGTLTDEVDCAVNCHDQGCHLLCHDDVIGTRKVSYILYLTDPEPKWTDEDGGRLELYDSVDEIVNSSEASDGLIKRKVPGVIPVKTILPTFNCMAYFVVEPGKSFHSVQEVFCDRPRLSIQGWYHAKTPPLQMENASLNQLKSNENEQETEGAFIPFNNSSSNGGEESDDNLTAEDMHFLSAYINETYLKPESINEIRERFEEESSVQLRHFFNVKWETKVNSSLIKEDTEQNAGRGRPALNYKLGISDDWLPVGPAHKQRFLEYVGVQQEDGTSCGSILAHLKQIVLQSPQFGRLLNSYSSLGMPLGYRGRVRRFRPGLDYTIAHYGILTQKSVLDATMCFVSGTGDQSLGEECDDDDDMMWQSDDKGGFECYIEADDEDVTEAADEYNDEDDTKLLSVSASNNTLSLVYRDPGTMRFVKYVGSGAPSSRWDISLEYDLEDDDDEEDDDDDENEKESVNAGK
mmetsp:Transcript_18417/g.22548  ORF Transcript_18417/g.22548 Transcript_18417/m.22548 type:complete len:584 (-) Transcript_18417:111-1862(-)